MALTVIAGLGAAYAAQANQVRLHKLRAEAETTKSKLQDTEHRAQLTKAQLEAVQREQKILQLPRPRRPIRKQGWFQETWQHLRDLRGASSVADEKLQGHAAAALEGIDAHLEKLLPGEPGAFAFDPTSERFLIVRTGVDRQGRAWSKT